MVDKRHQVSQIHPPRSLYLDDRLGPALVAVWMLALVGAVSIRWLAHEQWQQGHLLPVIGAAAIVLAALMSSAMLAATSPYRFRRGVVLALCLSLLFNLGIAVGLTRVYLTPPRMLLSVVKTAEPRTLEEFYPMAMDGDDRPQQEVRKPVSTGEPDRDDRDLVRKTTIRTDSDARIELDATPATQQRSRPTTVARREVVESVPRHAEQQGTLSRQMLKANPAVGAPIPVDHQALATSPAKSVEARETPLRKQLATEPSTRRDEADSSPPVQPTTARPAPSVLTRARSVEQAREQLEDVPPPRRSVTRDVTARDMETTPLPESPSIVAPRLVAAPVTREPRPQSTSPPPAEPLKVDPPPELVRLDNVGATRTQTLTSVPRTVSEPLELPDRQPMSAARPTSSSIDVEVLRSSAPTTESPTPTVLPDLERQLLATTDHPISLPSPRDIPQPPRPVVPDAGSRQTSETSVGVADAASDPAENASPRRSGTAAERMAAPRKQMLAADRLRRRAIRRPRATNSDESGSVSRVFRTSPEPEPSPAELTLQQDEGRQGQVEMIEVLSAPGVDQIEVGAQRAITDSEMSRAGGGRQPNPTPESMAYANPTDRRLTTSRPGLPTDVVSPEFEAPAADLAEPAATAASPGRIRRETGSVAAGPAIGSTEPMTGLPASDERLVEPRVARASAVAQRPPQLSAASGLPQRRVERGGARPVRSEVRVPLVQVPARTTATNEPNAATVAISDQLRTSPAEAPTRPSAGPPELRPTLTTQMQKSAESVARPSAVNASTVASTTRPQALPGLRPPLATAAAVPQATSQPDERPTVPSESIHSFALDTERRDMTGGLSGGLQVDLDVADGLGGFASDVASDIGTLSRRTSAESVHVADTVGRFIRREMGGRLSVVTDRVTPTKAYQTRLNRQGDQPFGGNGRPSPRTEESIELGLVYLAGLQREDGSWSLNEAGEDELEEPARTYPTIESDTAATGLCLLAFLGAGYHHRSDKYGDEILDALHYLIRHQKEDGDLYLAMNEASNQSAWLYSHAIATIALCEAFGMTQDADLRDPAQGAVDFIATSQNAQRGGWRYEPGVGSDTSVSGWMVMAMRSAELANLTVSIDAWENVENWLDEAQASRENPHFYRYNPFAPDRPTQIHGRRASRTITAVGLLMRLYTGWYRDDKSMIAGANYLGTNLPTMGSWEAPKRDTYYWYYATQVMFHMGGEYWENWNNELHPLLTSTQIQIGTLAGSWDPRQPMPDRWATHAGRIYVTTLNLLSLEVFYRHLPIYEDTVK